MRLLILCCLSFGISVNCHSQTDNYMVITGIVSDSDTNEPLPYATIAVAGTAIGVVSNEVGQFFINIPGIHLNGSVTVSMFGYHRLKASVKDLENAQNFELKQQVFELDEVLISARDKKMTGDDIWKLARKNQRSNLPDKDYRLTSFFRETYQLNGEYFKLLEAAATIYGRPFPRTKKDISIDEIRLIEGVKVSLSLSIGEDYNPFRDFKGATSGIPNRRACATCHYEIEEYILNDQGVSARITSNYISEDSTHQTRFAYLIDMNDYAVLQFEFETSIPFGLGFPKNVDSTYTSSLVYLKRKMSFIDYNGKHYLNQYHQHLKHEYRAIDSSEGSIPQSISFIWYQIILLPMSNT